MKLLKIKFKKIIVGFIFLVITLYFIVIGGIIYGFNQKSFDSVFLCSLHECHNIPSKFFLKLLADYKYNDKKSIEAIGLPPILWAVNLEKKLSDNEIIGMINHFIKMGFDINQSLGISETQHNGNALTTAVLYKNYTLVKALVSMGAKINDKNPDLDAYLFAMKINNSHLKAAEAKELEKIILFLEEKKKNETY
jgi:hypothetical protein